MEELISVIVPIYNVGAYLEECVESIRCQTYNNLDIILVDDGSDDGSEKQCDEYRLKDNRIKVIHKKNGGLSDARNVGLLAADGDYVMFIDSDDLIVPKMIEKLYRAIKACSSGVSICGFKKFENTANITNTCETKDVHTLSGREYIVSVYTGNDSGMGFVAWNKLYKKALFIEYDIRYPVGRIYEDAFTTYKLIYKSERVATVDEKLYYYRQRTGSIMYSKFTIQKCRDFIESDNSPLEDYYRWNDMDLVSFAFSDKCRNSITLFLAILKNRDFSEKKVCLKHIMEDYSCSWDKYHNRVSMQFAKRLLCLCFRLCCFFRRYL